MVVNVKAVAGFIESKTCRAGREFDSRVEADPIAAGVNDDEVVGAHAGDVRARAVGSPNDAARIAERLFALGLAYLRSFVSQVRIKIDDVGGQAEWIDLGQFDTDEHAVKNGLKAGAIVSVGAHDGNFAGGGIHGDRHADIHQARGVSDSETRSINYGQVMVGHVPTGQTAGQSGVSTTDIFGPIARIVVHPSSCAVLFDDNTDAWGKMDGRQFGRLDR